MELTNLQLNRFLYKDNSELNTSDVDTSIFKDINTTQGVAAGLANPSIPQIPSNSVTTGSVIQTSLVQSTPKVDRVQIDPSDDSFKAFRSGKVVVLINKNGITFFNLQGISQSIIDETGVVTEGLVVNNFFDYKGELQPVQFLARVTGATGVILGPLSQVWTCVRNSAGNYTITHNLNSPIYNVYFTPTNGNNVCNMSVVGLNSFTVVWVDLTGTPIDTNFRLTLQNTQL